MTFCKNLEDVFLEGKTQLKSLTTYMQQINRRRAPQQERILNLIRKTTEPPTTILKTGITLHKPTRQVLKIPTRREKLRGVLRQAALPQFTRIVQGPRCGLNYHDPNQSLVDKKFASLMKLPTIQSNIKRVIMADNRSTPVTKEAKPFHAKIGDTQTTLSGPILPIPKCKVKLGLDWMRKTKPHIDWDSVILTVALGVWGQLISVIGRGVLGLSTVICEDMISIVAEEHIEEELTITFEDWLLITQKHF
ncbi:hypothetical protein DSO57_1017460 [Entomophthora muscae]|uniref:Uncharacterized protein n=1 Tax=Entomophthora muscae TaxID=34485 RepID=A0ACC2RJ39_9FUNG|nr:hypothetical protein DSO57_1017460 [Entomophthora muscae]